MTCTLPQLHCPVAISAFLVGEGEGERLGGDIARRSLQCDACPDFVRADSGQRQSRPNSLTCTPAHRLLHAALSSRPAARSSNMATPPPYLLPAFDPQKAKVAELRGILLENDVRTLHPSLGRADTELATD